MVDAQESSCNKKKTVEDDHDDENDVHADLDRHHDVAFHKKNLGKKIRLTDNELIGQVTSMGRILWK